MKYLILILSCVSLSVFAAKNTSKDVVMKNGKGETVGKITLTSVPTGVSLKLDIKGLTPGEHAIHFHENGTCTGPKFESAGAHFAPDNKMHGRVKGGPHAGDMNNFVADANGVANLTMLSTTVTMDKGANALVKSGGTAVVIHEKKDDYVSQPAGDAGGRWACGEIK